jgi:hypothetical protein
VKNLLTIHIEIFIPAEAVPSAGFLKKKHFLQLIGGGKPNE